MEIEAVEGPCQDLRIGPQAEEKQNEEETMKSIITGLAALLLFAGAQAVLPNASYAQDDIKRMCTNKHGLGKNLPTASEAQRKEAAAKIAACIRSGGKS